MPAYPAKRMLAIIGVTGAEGRCKPSHGETIFDRSAPCPETHLDVHVF